MIRKRAFSTCFAVCAILLGTGAFSGCHPLGSGQHPPGMYQPSASRDEQIRKKAQKDKFPAAGEPVTDAVLDTAPPAAKGR